MRIVHSLLGRETRSFGVERAGRGAHGASGTDTNAEQFDVFSSMGADLRRLYAAPASIPKALETARVEESGGGDRPFPLA